MKYTDEVLRGAAASVGGACLAQSSTALQKTDVVSGAAGVGASSDVIVTR